MLTDNQPPGPGGAATQAGINYQNSIAAAQLFTMLVGADGVLSVMSESRDDAVDDIIVERHRLPRTYYQVKNILEPRWTTGRLIALGVLAAFEQQRLACDGECHLVLASPQPISQLGRLANLARLCASFDDLLSHDNLTQDMRAELASLQAALLTTENAFAYLQCHHEECWPSDASRIRDEVFGRYEPHPYGKAKQEIWGALYNVAADPSLHGRPVRRALLMEQLERASSYFLTQVDAPINILSIRGGARPEWYVHRHEEADFLRHYQQFLQGRPTNVVVMGDGGTGKSSFFEWVCRHLSESEHTALIRITALGGEFRDLLRSINVLVRDQLGLAPDRNDPEGLLPIEVLLRSAEQARKQDRRLVIAIDGFDSFFSSLVLLNSRDKIHQARYSFFEAIRRTLDAARVMWVVFARSEHFFLMFERDEDRAALAFEWIHLSEFDEDQAEALLAKLCRLSGKMFGPGGVSALLNYTGLHPQKLALAFLHLVNAVRQPEMTEDLIIKLQPWQSTFQADLETLDLVERRVVVAIAGLMARGDGRVFSAEQIDVELTRRRVAEPHGRELGDVLHRLQAAHFLLRQPERGLFTLYHDNFARFVIAQAGGLAGDVERIAEQERLEQFVPMFLHELKNHSAMLQGLSSDLAREINRLLPQAMGETGRVRDHLRRLTRGLEIYGSQIRVFGDFTGRGSRRERQPTRLYEVVQRVIDTMDIRGRHELRVHWDRRDSQGLIAGDADVVSVAVYNVVDNARRHALPPSAIEIRLIEEDKRIVLSVTNPTSPIPGDHLDRLFQAGMRGPEALRRSPSGLGLGLVLVKTIMEGLGGDVHLAVEPRGDIAQFTCTLGFPVYTR